MNALLAPTALPRPEGLARTELDGPSREFKESGAALLFTFLLALAFIYLVLSAQFESFKSPFVIMLTVPLAMTGALIDSQRALQIGLVDEVWPDDELAERAHTYAAGIAAGASVAIDLARRAIRRSLERDLDSAISYESWAQSAVGNTTDTKEGIRAFIEKREPKFRGE